MSHSRVLNIGFIHPDLGLGGAERLVVDAALELQTAGHRVTMFTAHHDPTRCFEETRDGTLDVRVHGNFLPMHVRQRLRAPCAIVRMAYLACVMERRGGPFDVIICDLVSHAIPLLKRFSSAKILFYCHFPDQLLAPRRDGLYRVYRAPIDRLEAITTCMADRVLVNSEFTASVFRRIFARQHSVPPEVVYPGVDCTRFEPNAASPPAPEHGSAITILSINRYERKKNLGLAIEAVALLRERLSAEEFERIELVVAGGYDERLPENREVLAELRDLAKRLRIEEKVVFLQSFTEEERLELLARCRCVVYTPEDEHFGIVPVEAMAAGRPVVTVDSGGPRETVRDGETGFRCPSTAAAFAEALARFVNDPVMAARMGEAGRLHVTKHFSRAAFGARLEAIIRDVVGGIA